VEASALSFSPAPADYDAPALAKTDGTVDAVAPIEESELDFAPPAIEPEPEAVASEAKNEQATAAGEV
jgi:hypothetical protein